MDEQQTRQMTDDEATNSRLAQWWAREMELLQGMIDSGHLYGPPSVGMAARGLWNMAYAAGLAAHPHTAGELATELRHYLIATSPENIFDREYEPVTRIIGYDGPLDLDAIAAHAIEYLSDDGRCHHDDSDPACWHFGGRDGRDG